MKFGIMACGGVGGYFGGLLSASGNETHFVARGKHLESMSKNGLQIKCIEPKDFIIKNASFTEDPKKIGACDVIIFCVKTMCFHRANEKQGRDECLCVVRLELVILPTKGYF